MCQTSRDDGYALRSERTVRLSRYQHRASIVHWPATVNWLRIRRSEGRCWWSCYWCIYRILMIFWWPFFSLDVDIVEGKVKYGIFCRWFECWCDRIVCWPYYFIYRVNLGEILMADFCYITYYLLRDVLLPCKLKFCDATCTLQVWKVCCATCAFQYRFFTQQRIFTFRTNVSNTTVINWKFSYKVRSLRGDRVHRPANPS